MLVVGDVVARRLNLTMGDTLQIRDYEFTVVGLLAKTGSQDDQLLIAPLPVAQEILDKQGLVSMVEIAALCHDCPLADIVNQLQTALPGVDVQAVQQVVKTRMHALGQFRLFAWGVAVTVVIIGALLVFVTMMGAISERTREIGIFRAIGYRRRHVLHLVLMEAAIVSLFIVSLTIFRWSYYGSILPNTYTLRMTGLPFMYRVRGGMGFVGLFLGTISIPLVISLFGICLNFNKKRLLLSSLVFSSIIYQICIGGDMWPYWRFLSPYLPLLFVLCLDGLSNVLYRFIKNDIYISGRCVSRFQLEKLIISIVLLIMLVKANAKMAVRPMPDSFSIQVNRLVNGIDHHKVITQTMHF